MTCRQKITHSLEAQNLGHIAEQDAIGAIHFPSDAVEQSAVMGGVAGGPHSLDAKIAAEAAEDPDVDRSYQDHQQIDRDWPIVKLWGWGRIEYGKDCEVIGRLSTTCAPTGQEMLRIDLFHGDEPAPRSTTIHAVGDFQALNPLSEAQCRAIIKMEGGDFRPLRLKKYLDAVAKRLQGEGPGAESAKLRTWDELNRQAVAAKTGTLRDQMTQAFAASLHNSISTAGLLDQIRAAGEAGQARPMTAVEIEIEAARDKWARERAAEDQKQ